MTTTLMPAAPGAGATATAAPAGPWRAPRVDLLPPEVLGRRTVERVKRGAAVAAAITVVGLGGAWLLGQAALGSAQDDLDAANSRVQALRAQQAQYAAAPETITKVAAAQTARATAMAQDVRWYSYIDSLTGALPAGAWVESVTTSLDTAASATAGAASTGTTTDGSAATGIGTVTISAKSTSYDDVAGYLDALAAVPGVSGTYLTTSSQDASGNPPVVSFTVTAVVTADALSHRYDATTTEGSVG